MTDDVAFEDLYDDDVVAALDAWGSRHVAEPPTTRGRVGRGGLAGVAFSAIALGLRDVLEGEDHQEQTVEIRPLHDDDLFGWVSFVQVPGAPHRSRLVVRPWFAPESAEA